MALYIYISYSGLLHMDNTEVAKKRGLKMADEIHKVEEILDNNYYHICMSHT